EVAMDMPHRPAAFTLTSQRLGAIPLVNHFLARMRLDEVLGRWLPGHDARCQIRPATLARIVITNLVVDHQPLYGLGEWANAHAPAALGVPADQLTVLNDDRAGRMLDRLLRADRVSMLAELMVAVSATFSVDTSRLHNDSTSLSVHGAYPS